MHAKKHRLSIQKLKYLSVSKIEYNQNETLNFDFPTGKVEDINKIIKSLNPRKATGPDGIPGKILKIARNVFDPHITYYK